MNKMVLIPHSKYQHLLKKSETSEISEAESQTEPLSAPRQETEAQAEEEGQAVSKISSSTPSESLATTISASEASSGSARAPPGINYREELRGKGSVLKQKKKKKKKTAKRKPVNFPERNIVNSWIHF